MAEYERRAELERSRAKKLEDSLHQVSRGINWELRGVNDFVSSSVKLVLRSVYPLKFARGR